MSDQTAILKILEMLQAGALTAEQADRLIRELQAPSSGTTKEVPTESKEQDLFSTFQNIGAQVARGVEDLAKGLGSNFKQALGVPQLQTLVVKTIKIEPEKEITRLNIPLHLFYAVRGLLTNGLLTSTSPLIDFDLVYKTLEEGTGGKIAQFIDTPNNQRIEFWLE